MKSKSRIGAYILIGLGIIFLLSNLGLLPRLRPLMAQWWPLILIIAGVLLLLRRKSSYCDLFVVVGSSLAVSPANDMPRLALRSGARLVIINQGETPMDRSCHLRFEEAIGEVLPPAVKKLKELMKN